MKYAVIFLLLGASAFGEPPGEEETPAPSLNAGRSAAVLPGGHRGAVTALAGDGELVVSAGEDGFLELWNAENGAAEERFQISPYPVRAMVKRPGRSQVCVTETDGFALHRISVWDYAAKKRLFALRLADPVSRMSYSAEGNFITVTRPGRTGAVFIHAETGEAAASPGMDAAPVLAVRGPEFTEGEDTEGGEGFMAAYFSGGVLSHWDLETGDETDRLEVPANLTSVTFFGGRCLAGLDSRGRVILDIVSGDVLARENGVRKDALLSAGPGAGELSCVQGGATPVYTRWRMERRLVRREQIRLAGNHRISAFLAADTPVLGLEDGRLAALNKNGSLDLFKSGSREKIVEAAVSGDRIAFITEGNRMGFLPLDFSGIENLSVRLAEFPRDAAYTRVSGLDGGEFILWQTESGRQFPVAVKDGVYGLVFDRLGLRFPLRTVSAFGEKVLFLDAGGNAAVAGAKTGERSFLFPAAGSMDGSFTDGDNILLARSAVSGNSPFLKVNITSGETVPIDWPSSAGIRVYRGSSGAVYAAAVSENPLKTIILAIAGAASVQLLEYGGEDSSLSMAESKGMPVLNPAGGGAVMVGKDGKIIPLERGSGLPLKLLDGGPCLVTVDGDGNISWQDGETGKLLAVFSLGEESWTLRSGDGTVQGEISRDSGFSAPSQ
jgi:WD40 repeat protein